MKISKLFHWLYGFLMLMPIFAIGVTCGYAIFNKNAYQSYVDIKSTTLSAVSNYNSIIYNNQYLIQYENQYTSVGSYTDSPRFYYSQININWEDYGFSPGYTWTNFQVRNDGYIYLRDNNDYQEIKLIWGTQLKEVVLTLTNVTPDYNFNKGSTILYFYTIINKPLSDVFYYAVDKVVESPLFNWSLDSFLSTPFTYILNLFNVPNNSVMLLLLSYWLDISIIWLTFDVLMYVPLLTHRWLDKGVLE